MGLALVVSACAANSTQTRLPGILLPATLDFSTVDASGSLGVVRVRVYAGADYRARSLGWQDELSTVFSQVSAIFEQHSNLRIELVEAKDWKRSGGKLAGTLKSLKSHDPGPDVDLVVGLIDAPTGHEVEMKELVLADTLGRHIVVRSFNQQAEREHLSLAQYGLAESQEEQLLTVRKSHKETVLLAHGISELFGASDTVAGANTVDGRHYSTSADSLSPDAARIVSISSAAHLSGDDKAAAWTQAGIALAKLGVGPELLSIVALRQEASDGPDTEEAKGIRPADRTRLVAARRLLAAGKHVEAWESLEPLVERYPREYEVSDTACALSVLRNSNDALSHCTLAVTLHKDSAMNWISLGAIRAETGPSLALKNLQHAELLLGQSGNPAPQRVWMELARGYKKMSLPSLAKKAAVQAVGGESGVAKISQVEKWATQMRVRYGAGIGMKEALEGDYLTTLREGLALVYKEDYAKAEAKAAVLSQAYPTSIGSNLLTCEVRLRRRKYAAARRSCQAIVTRQPANAWATYLLGVIDVRQSRQASGIAKLQEAIARDPQLDAAYQALATIYRKSKDTRLPELKRRYQVQLGRVLP